MVQHLLESLAHLVPLNKDKLPNLAGMATTDILCHQTREIILLTHQ